MLSPSPSDLVWVIRISPDSRWMVPVVRGAVREIWQEAQQIAIAQLGDETLASELMEVAIQQTAEQLANSSPIGVAATQEILSRFYRNAVRRRKRTIERIVFRGTTREIEFLLPPVKSFENAVEADIDLDTILDETPPDLRRAMLMRLGARSSWKDVAQETGKSIDAIRMGCRREIDRIRRRFRIWGRDHEQ
jgi:DNA-directed RNA polymerase specialized sigma24 family protein